jgi:hypothetical protein
MSVITPTGMKVCYTHPWKVQKEPTQRKIHMFKASQTSGYKRKEDDQEIRDLVTQM